MARSWNYCELAAAFLAVALSPRVVFPLLLPELEEQFYVGPHRCKSSLHGSKQEFHFLSPLLSTTPCLGFFSYHFTETALLTSTVLSF